MNQDDETRLIVTQSGAELHLPAGMVIGQYRLLRLLGVGAMGAVYLGEHIKIGRHDAIKVLQSAMASDPEAVARFDRGARNVGAIRHSNVCTIYDFNETAEGLQYLAMEYVEGETLKEVLDRTHILPIDRALDIAAQVADALTAAHLAGIVHRDLKPANIMLTSVNGREIVKVVDFDISKSGSDGLQEEVTRLGFVVGTIEYMSPEQLVGSALDGRSDVYSLAVVLFRMLAGGFPYAGDTAQHTVHARLTDMPMRRLRDSSVNAYPHELQDILDHALARLPEARTKSAAEFARQLRAIPRAIVNQVAVVETGMDRRETPAISGTGVINRAPRNAVRSVAVGAAAIAIITLAGFGANAAGWLDKVQNAAPDTLQKSDGLDTSSVKSIAPDGAGSKPDSPKSAGSNNPTPATRLLDNAVSADACASSLVGADALNGCPALPFNVRVTELSRKRTFRMGDTLNFYVRTARGGYITLYDVDPDGKVDVLCPRVLDDGSSFHPRLETGFDNPIPGSAMDIVAASPSGRRRLRAIVSAEPLMIPQFGNTADARTLEARLKKALQSAPEGSWSTGTLYYDVIK